LADPIFASEEISGNVNRVAFDHSGQYVAVAGADIQLYSVKESSLAHVARLSGHKGAVTGVAWGTDAKSVFSVSSDKTLKTFSSK
jgi:pre-mRNA-processing factor 19